MKKKKIVPGKLVLPLLCALFAIIVPLCTNRYQITVVNTAMLYFLGALGISVMMGMCGQMSFASISFIGIGAYAATQFAKTLGMPTLVALIAAVIFTALVSLIIGMLLLRLSGGYFTFATMGLVNICAALFINLKPLTGGANGIIGIPKLSIFGFTFDTLYKWFFLLLAVCVGCGLVVQRIRKTSLGRSMAAVRDNELAAKSLGINCYQVKVISFVIAGAFAGLSGALLAFHNGAVSYALFSFTNATNFVIMVMLGGVNSTIGTFLGTFLVTLMPEVLRPLASYLVLIQGFMIILMMIFMPMGLAGIGHAIRDNYKKWIAQLLHRFGKKTGKEAL